MEPSRGDAGAMNADTLNLPSHTRRSLVMILMFDFQAIDRTHRLGQHKPIFATRFIIENTIEERILKLQV